MQNSEELFALYDRYTHQAKVTAVLDYLCSLGKYFESL